MARFWKRGEDRSIEQLLRANRPEPSDEFASSILNQIADAPASATPRRTRSPQRLALALVVTVALIGLAGVLGGISAASAGLGGIAHVAKNAVAPSPSTSVKTTSSTKNDKGVGNDNGNVGDDGNHDGDHHQYQVGVCHWANHKYVLIFTSPQGAANHFAHHPNDKIPVDGHC